MTVFVCVAALGQQMNVYVRSGDVPLPFAFVSVNNRYKATADSLGVARIAAAELRKGDAIAANYFGQQSAISYDGSQHVELSLDALEIDSVAVSGRFKWWQHIKYPRIRNYYQTIYGAFEIEPAGSSEKITGAGRYTVVRRKPTADNDSPDEVTYELTYASAPPEQRPSKRGAHILDHVSLEISLYPYAWNNRGMTIVPAEPEKNGITSYSIIRPALRARNDYNILNGANTIYVDVATKRIVRAVGRIEYTDRSISFEASYALSDGVTYPTDVTATYVIKETGREVVYRFSGMKITKRDKKGVEVEK